MTGTGKKGQASEMDEADKTDNLTLREQQYD